MSMPTTLGCHRQSTDLDGLQIPSVLLVLLLALSKHIGPPSGFRSQPDASSDSYLSSIHPQMCLRNGLAG